MLRMMKGALILGMKPTQRRQCSNRSTSTAWNSGTAFKLIKRKLMVDRVNDGCSQKSMWSRCSSRNRVNTTCGLLLKAAREHATLLWDHNDMSSENRTLAKNEILLRSSSRNDYTCNRPTHNIRVECFWHEHSTAAKDHFLQKFRNLECLGVLKVTETLTFCHCAWLARRKWSTK